MDWSDKGDANSKNTQGLKLGDPGAFLTGKENCVMEEREAVTANSRIDGRIWVFRRPENQPMREGWWSRTGSLRRRRSEGSSTAPVES